MDLDSVVGFEERFNLYSSSSERTLLEMSVCQVPQDTYINRAADDTVLIVNSHWHCLKRGTSCVSSFLRILMHIVLVSAHIPVHTLDEEA